MTPIGVKERKIHLKFIKKFILYVTCDQMGKITMVKFHQPLPPTVYS